MSDKSQRVLEIVREDILSLAKEVGRLRISIEQQNNLFPQFVECSPMLVFLNWLKCT